MQKLLLCNIVLTSKTHFLTLVSYGKSLSGKYDWFLVQYHKDFSFQFRSVDISYNVVNSF